MPISTLGGGKKVFSAAKKCMQSIEILGWGFDNYCPACGSNKGSRYPYYSPVPNKEYKCDNCGTYFCKSELMKELEYKNTKRTKLIDRMTNAEKT